MSGAIPAPVFDGPLAERLSGEQTDEELDGGALLGWFSLYRNPERPGGAILHCDVDGFVTSWYTPSAARLGESWAQIRATVAALAAEAPG